MSPLPPKIRAERNETVVLALIAGYVDAYGLAKLGTFVSYMSGNTTQAGLSLGTAVWAKALPSGVAIVSYVVGSFAGTWLTHTGWRQSRRLILAAVAVALAVSPLLEPRSQSGTIAVLAVAMGLMNAVRTRVGPESVSLTFVTGTLSRMASHLALAAHGAPLADKGGPGDSHVQRAKMLASVWASFFVGAILSGVLGLWLGALSLVPPLAPILWLAAWPRPLPAER